MHSNGLSDDAMSTPDLEIIKEDSHIHISDDKLETLFWEMHPRHAFFKTLPRGANLLDIGANDGALHYWKEWGNLHRPDLKLYGVDLNYGRLAHFYSGWDALNLDHRMPDFPGIKFDGFLATHLIEHLTNVDDLFAYMRQTAAPGARIYLEWPAPRTKRFPTASQLANAGFTIQTYNFFDDTTHIDTYSCEEVSGKLERNGFETQSSGYVDLGVVARELAIRGRIADNMSWRQMGIWCATGWCNYVLAKLPL